MLSLLFLISHQVYGQQAIYSQFDSVINSESVPINDMLTGWDGDYQRGELVYADVSWSFGFNSDLIIAGESLGQLNIQREYRHYYYLNYDKETSDYYRALELGNTLASNKKLDLILKQFDAPGISLGYQTKMLQCEAFNWQAGFDLALYQPGNFQFASIKGAAEAGDASAASGLINYRYNDDKLLDHQADVSKGLGLSLSTNLILEMDGWQAEVQLKDMLNQFQWHDAAFTQGCINVGGGSRAQCDAVGAASGISGQRAVTESIPLTLTSRIRHTARDLTLHGLFHDRYYRLGLEKGVQTSLGRLAFFLYYPRLVGLSWQASVFNIQLGADSLKLSQARNIQLNMGINWRW
jgi:hypothetical protein